MKWLQKFRHLLNGCLFYLQELMVLAHVPGTIVFFNVKVSRMLEFYACINEMVAEIIYIYIYIGFLMKFFLSL